MKIGALESGQENFSKLVKTRNRGSFNATLLQMISMRPTEIFVYGSLRKGGSNHSLLASSKFIGTAKTVQKLIMRARAFPFVSDDQQVSYIHGEVYSVNSSVLRKVDRLESYDVLSPENSWYKREEILVKMDNDPRSPRKVAMYFNRKENKAPIIASGDFFNFEDRKQSTEVVHYFAYGSNRNPVRLRTERGICFSQRYCAKLHDYRLVFNKRSSDGNSSYANIQASKGDFVDGILYQLPLASIQKLDTYEGAPYHYFREQMVVEMSGKKVLAEVYIAHPDWIQEGLEPSKEYLAHCNYGL